MEIILGILAVAAGMALTVWIGIAVCKDRDKKSS